jgi:type III pantothenate kinase
MLFVIDVGNTNITLGLYPKTAGSSSDIPAPLWRLPSRRDATADELSSQIHTLFQVSGIALSTVQGIVVASVVPPLDDALSESLERTFKVKPLFVGPGVRTGVKNLYQPPEVVGADRLVDAAAAYARVRGACLVVDFGTATTIDCVDQKGAYLGGVIVPGPKMAAEALAKGTAKLPLLEHLRRPAKVIGRTTQDSLASGLYYGYADLVAGLIRRLKAELGGKPVVLATGGLAELWAPLIPGLKAVVPHLTLEGLRLIWSRNQ